MAFHRYAVLTAFATFVLVIAGGLVTSTDSGLAVPDWPLSYGMWFPPMVGGIFYEHGHRMIAATVGLMILALAARLWKVERRRWVRRLAYSALAAVIAQGLLGGLTVLWLLPPQISIAHACLGQSLFCLVVCLAISTAPAWTESPEPLVHPRVVLLRRASLSVAVIAFIQLILGAVIRHTGAGVGAHVAGAAALVVASGWCAALLSQHRRHARELWGHAIRLLLLLGGQLLVGLSVFLHRADVMLRTAHVAMGALVLVQAVVLAWLIVRSSGIRYRFKNRANHQAVSDTGIASAYFELTKPRLTAMVLVTTAAGFWLGSAGPERWAQLCAVLFGTALVAGGANALNEWMERSEDALMQRTRMRPIPSGRLPAERARRFGLLLVAGGLMWLVVMVNALAATLAALSAASYLLLYTPLKRRTPLCTLAGAIPGALPPVIGWAAARQTLGLEAWALFLLLFVWQLPHFLAIAVLYREDYAQAGYRMLPVTEPDGRMTARQTVLYGLVLVPISLFPSMIGLAGPWYFYGALALSLGFLAVAMRAAWRRSMRNAQLLFRSSILYLPALLGLLVWNQGWR